MRIRTLLLVLMLALVAAFGVLNWPAFTAPTTLNLGFASVDAALGLVMLGILVAVILAFVAYIALWQGAMLLEARRHMKELQAQRALADQAEASRFTELRNVLLAEVARVTERIAQAQDALVAEMRDHSNSIAAMVGEIDEVIKRDGGRQSR